MSNIKIYKISSGETDSVYVGSTQYELKQRLCKHRTDYKRFKAGLRTNISSFEIVQFNDAKIELVCLCDKENRCTEEKRVQDETENCINKYDPAKYHLGIRKEFDTPDNFTDEQIEKINATANYNSKCVLQNYYRNRDAKLRLCALRKIRLKGELPLPKTIDKYNISVLEIRNALKEHNKIKN